MNIRSHSWTGRVAWADTPAQWLRRNIELTLYPMFECEGCVEGAPERGCYCAFMGGIAPDTGPGRIRVFLRGLFDGVVWDPSDYDLQELDFDGS